MKKRFLYPIVGVLLWAIIAGTVITGYNLYGFLAVPVILVTYGAIILGYFLGCEEEGKTDIFHARKDEEDD